MLTGDLDQLFVKVSAKDITMAVDYDRLPFPLALTGDGFTYAADGITFRNFAGQIRDSNFENISAN